MTNSPKQLQAFIQYVQSVSEKENIKALPGPWLDPLPEKLLLKNFMLWKIGQLLSGINRKNIYK